MNIKIKLARIEKGYKQIELSGIIGITPQYLRLIENGKANPSREIIKKISDILEKPVEELFF